MAKTNLVLAFLARTLSSNEAISLKSFRGSSLAEIERNTMDIEVSVMNIAREIPQEEMSASMTLEKAHMTFMKMNHSKIDSKVMAMIQRTLSGTASEPKGYAAVDKARDMLNDMMDEATMKRELEDVKCRESDRDQLKEIRELEIDISYVNSEASAAKAEMLRATEMIQILSEIKIPNNRMELYQHNHKCRIEIATLEQQLAVVLADIDVMKSILGMVCADDVRTTTVEPALLQSSLRMGAGSLVKCVSCMTGRQIAYLRHSRMQPLLASLKSKVAKDYLQENLLKMFNKDDAKPVTPVFLQEKEIRNLPVSTGLDIPALASRFNFSGTVTGAATAAGAHCNEQMTGENSNMYQGCQDETLNGKKCQIWSHQSPHKHNNTNLGDHNFCRNPDGKDTIWCYTEEPGTVWEYCQPKISLKAPDQVAKHDCVEANMCKLKQADCGNLRDRFMVIMAGILDMKDKLSDDLDTLRNYCQEVKENYENTISNLLAQLKEEQKNLAVATKYMTENQQSSELSNINHKTLSKEYHDEMVECCDTKNDLTAEICALEKIRGELYKLEGLKVFITDCEVSEWVDEECSVPCGGGTQTRTRAIIIHPINGTQCPPLKMSRGCNLLGCPVDCAVSDWSGWSDCTGDCGGGIRTRSRDKTVEPQNGGDPCPDQSETASCNMQACNVPCTLADWSEWSLCPKQCDTGHKERTRAVVEPAVGTGECAAWDDKTRLEYMVCNTNRCEEILTPDRTLIHCTAMIDVVLLIDGSSSLTQYGWEETKSSAHSLVNALSGGSTGVNLAVILFSGPEDYGDLTACTGSNPNAVVTNEMCGIQWVSHMTSNMSDVVAGIDRMEWPKRTTLTALALANAHSELLNGRQEASSVVIVVTDGKPMSPIKTGFASEQLKKSSRLMWVPVGQEVESAVESMKWWASSPWEDNVIRVDTFAALNTPMVINDVLAGFCPIVQ